MSDLEKEVNLKQKVADTAVNTSDESDSIDAEIEKLNKNIRNSEIMAVILGVVTTVTLIARIIA